MRFLAALLLASLLAGACASTGNSTLVGSVIAVDGDLVDVRTFEVLSDGASFEFRPALDGNFSIPLVHLRDHLRSGEPVRVTYREVEGELVASDVVDAEARH
jgi:hypothetical protein